MPGDKLVLPLYKRILGGKVEWPIYEVETVWVLRKEAAIYQVDNIPFYSTEVSCYDLIECAPSHDSRLQIRRVLERSQHATLRAILANNELVDIADETAKKLTELGCAREVAGAQGGLITIAFDVPPTVDLRRVMDIANKASSEGAIYLDLGFIPEGRWSSG